MSLLLLLGLCHYILSKAKKKVYVSGNMTKNCLRLGRQFCFDTLFSFSLNSNSFKVKKYKFDIKCMRVITRKLEKQTDKSPR